MNTCLTLVSGPGLAHTKVEATVANALGMLRNWDKDTRHMDWAVTWQTYTEHTKVTAAWPGGGSNFVIRVPHSVLLLLDGRYHISHTWVGEPEQRWVAWFQDTYLGHFATDIEAAEALFSYRRDVQQLAD
ncbi:hypothetical protein AB0M10_15220 [Streptomyces sp. NPDC051840]|uniref:hypothetical protein n=1 Tax=Streptomyces sp. NPDC051840 TaxID=3154752 RepID=UPI0034414C8E